MKPPFKLKPLMVLASVIGVAYPFAVYFGLQFFTPLVISIGLMVFLGFRIVLQWHDKKETIHIVSLGLTICVAGILAFVDTMLAVKSYPISLCLSLAFVFGYSLLHPPAIIERFARMVEPDLNESGVHYTRNVTFIWIIFFILNACISLWTALYSDLKTWTFYNGFLSYIFMGCLFAVEFVVRQFVKKNHVGTHS